MTAEDDNSAQELIDLSSEITGNAAVAAIGFLVAGPVGAMAGAFSGPAIAKTIKLVAKEINDRFLAKREKIRIGATLNYAAQKIQQRLDAGDQIRQDDFFNFEASARPPAEEILEGVLIASQKEHEEKKLEFYGNLVANLAFDSSYSLQEANYLLKVAQNLTYQQLCLLSLFGRSVHGLRKTDYRGQGEFDTKLISLLQEIYELSSLGMLNCSGEVLFSLTDVNPGKIKVQGTGEFLLKLMELGSIDIDELTPLAVRLT